jgi:DNA-binding transcriptional MerR regulator
MSKTMIRANASAKHISVHDTVSDKNIADFIADQEADKDYIGIADMAKQCQTTFRTLRFYEARGLLKPKREGANRLYDSNTKHRYKLIDEGRKLGFTLSEIAELLGPSTNVRELKLSVQKIKEQMQHLERQRTEIEVALALLRRRYYMLSEPGLEASA